MIRLQVVSQARKAHRVCKARLVCVEHKNKMVGQGSFGVLVCDNCRSNCSLESLQGCEHRCCHRCVQKFKSQGCPLCCRLAGFGARQIDFVVHGPPSLWHSVIQLLIALISLFATVLSLIPVLIIPITVVLSLTFMTHMNCQEFCVVIKPQLLTG